MCERLVRIWKEHSGVLRYIIFGVLTTLVNYLVYFPLYNIWNFSAALATAISWCIAVLFAFLTNKPFVFESKDWSIKCVASEFLRFVGMRVISGLLETYLMALTVDDLQWNGNLMKIVVSVLVVILNYIGSKFLIFRKQ